MSCLVVKTTKSRTSTVDANLIANELTLKKPQRLSTHVPLVDRVTHNVSFRFGGQVST